MESRLHANVDNERQPLSCHVSLSSIRGPPPLLHTQGLRDQDKTPHLTHEAAWSLNIEVYHIVIRERDLRPPNILGTEGVWYDCSRPGPWRMSLNFLNPPPSFTRPQTLRRIGEGICAESHSHPLTRYGIWSFSSPICDATRPKPSTRGKGKNVFVLPDPCP